MTSLRHLLLLSFAIAISVFGNGSSNVSAGDASALAASSSEVSTSQAAGQHVSGWRRTASGWENTDDWTTSSSSTGETRATKLHPSLIAVFVVLVSLGGLLGFEPLFRRRRQRLVKSDKVLIQNWGGRLRRGADSYECL